MTRPQQKISTGIPGFPARALRFHSEESSGESEEGVKLKTEGRWFSEVGHWETNVKGENSFKIEGHSTGIVMLGKEDVVGIEESKLVVGIETGIITGAKSEILLGPKLDIHYGPTYEMSSSHVVELHDIGPTEVETELKQLVLRSKQQVVAKLEQEIGVASRKIVDLKDEVLAANRTIGTQTDKIASLEQTIGSLQTEIGAVDAKFADVNATIGALSANVATKVDLQALEAIKLECLGEIELKVGLVRLQLGTFAANIAGNLTVSP
jgi:hypothetical protein